MDAVVARSVLSYVAARGEVLREAWRVLRAGGAISIFEPVLSEEELSLDWGEERFLWIRLRQLLESEHPAYGFKRADLVDAVRQAGFEQVDSFTWHADVTRRFSGEEEALDELESGLPGEFGLAAFWRRHGVSAGETASIARRLAAQSVKPSYRDILPCVYVWGVRGGAGETKER